MNGGVPNATAPGVSVAAERALVPASPRDIEDFAAEMDAMSSPHRRASAGSSYLAAAQESLTAAVQMELPARAAASAADQIHQATLMVREMGQQQALLAATNMALTAAKKVPDTILNQK